MHNNGKLKRDGRGLSFWFLPMTTAVAEVPMDDRDLAILFHGRTRDYQDVAVQGVITWRVENARTLAERIDFTVDLLTGQYVKQPLDQMATLLTGLVQQAALGYMAEKPVRELLADGTGPVQTVIEGGLDGAEIIRNMGLEIVSVRIADLSPTTELETALQTPTREKIQEEADRAVFERRAQAVEEERAIAENELNNQVELAKREEKLIAQQGANERDRVTGEAEARLIEQKAKAKRDEIDTLTRAERIRAIEGARVKADRDRMEIYRDLPAGVLMGLAARELAENIQGIEHLNVTPDLIGPVLTNFIQAGTDKLARDKGD
jgi:regulator of protease activity HflC (stomatin/prohibitin superfamily)